MNIGLVNDVILLLYILIDKIGFVSAIGIDSANSDRCQKDILRFFFCEEFFDVGLPY